MFVDACKHVCVCVFCFRFGIGSTSGSNKKVVGLYWTRSNNSRVTCSACSDTSANIWLSTASTNQTLQQWLLFHMIRPHTKIWLDERHDNMCSTRILSPSCCGSDHMHTHAHRIIFVSVLKWIFTYAQCPWISQGYSRFLRAFPSNKDAPNRGLEAPFGLDDTCPSAPLSSCGWLARYEHSPNRNAW